PEFQVQAARRLAAFPQYQATLALVRMAVLSEFVVVRDEAARALKLRPLSEAVPWLLGGLQAPLQTQYQINMLPNGAVAYRHVLVRETPEQRNVAIADSLARPTPATQTFLLPRETRGSVLAATYDDSSWASQQHAATQAANAAQSTESVLDLVRQTGERTNR